MNTDALQRSRPAAVNERTTPLSGITALVLAGGRGTRLRSVVHDRAKSMASVNGVPFLTYLLDQIVLVGIRQVVICTGIFSESVTSWFGTSYKGLTIAYSHETQPRGTAGALRQAMDSLDDYPVLVMNGDSFCEVAIDRFLGWHRKKSGAVSMALVWVEQSQRFGSVQFDASHRLTRFSEKGSVSGPAWVNAGLYLVERAFVESIPADQSCSLETEIFPLWISRGIYGFPCRGRFLDIGTPISYRLAQEFFPYIGTKDNAFPGGNATERPS